MNRGRSYGEGNKRTERRRRSSSSSSSTSSAGSDSESRSRAIKGSRHGRRSAGGGSSNRYKNSADGRSHESRCGSKATCDRRSRSRDRNVSRNWPNEESSDKYKKKNIKRRSRSSSTSSESSNSNSNSRHSSSVKNRQSSKSVAPNLQAKIEEKLDLGSQVQRMLAIEEIEKEGFHQSTFKSTAKFPIPLDEIPLPPLELKPVTLTNLDKEILCHPTLIINQREREDQWVKKLFSLRQKLHATRDV